MAIPTDFTALIASARGGDRRALARLITMVEERRPDHDKVLTALYTFGGDGWTTGITGAPGAGKSTLVDGLIAAIRRRDTEVAVLAIDPSSPFTGGAVLGDRVRMQDHIADSGVYVRSMASRGHLGGISATTPQAVAVIDGVGFPEILVETVGVGQAEVEIAAKTDTTVVVVNPGWGDSIQAAKAGLLEVGDIFVVNKADRPGVDQTISDLKQMLELGGERAWWPPIVPTIAADREGIDDLMAAIETHRTFLGSEDRLQTVRMGRIEAEVDAALSAELRTELNKRVDTKKQAKLLADVAERRLDPWAAAAELAAGLFKTS